VIILTISSMLVSALRRTPTTLPRRITRKRSATEKACSMLWVMMMIEAPLFFSSRTISSTWCASSTPSAAVGSSRITIFFPKLAALATPRTGAGLRKGGDPLAAAFHPDPEGLQLLDGLLFHLSLVEDLERADAFLQLAPRNRFW